MSTALIISLTILATFSVLTMLALLVMVAAMFGRVAALPSLDTRMQHMEQYLRDISDQPNSQVLYRTDDGRYMANSSEDVMKLMIEDPQSTLTSDHKDALISFLSHLQKEVSGPEFMTDDDDDDDDSPPLGI